MRSEIFGFAAIASTNENSVTVINRLIMKMKIREACLRQPYIAHARRLGRDASHSLRDL